jgi:hypothetical protein
MSEKKGLIKVIDAIDHGATTVEKIHKSIAELPLKIVEQSEILRNSAKQVRQFQDRTLGAIYDVVRDVNQKVGELAVDLLEKGPTVRKSNPKAAPKRHAAAHGAVH